MVRFGVVLLVASGLSVSASAATVVPGSPLANLVSLMMGAITCQGPATEAQMGEIQAAGQRLQTAAGASDADMQAYVSGMGDPTPAGGCDKFKADFPALYDKTIAAAK